MNFWLDASAQAGLPSYKIYNRMPAALVFLDRAPATPPKTYCLRAYRSFLIDNLTTDRPYFGEKAILVHIILPQDGLLDKAEEFSQLARSADVDVLEHISVRLSEPNPKYCIGAGKLDEIKQLVGLHAASVVLFDHKLTPAQERNLERAFSCRVLDRTGLILDIFAQRAQSHEGKLQVELAQLEHLSTRLVRGWTHLERQKGGIGLRGPGETQLETDRRLLRQRIKNILSRLKQVAKHRAQGRRARERAIIPTISLVGYTNAGKSTLFNALTTAEVLAADQLFATLDPTMRRVEIPGLGAVILADTVGFIRDLPHELVRAFQATLEETVNADLLLHVIDASHPNRDKQRQQVQRVLAEIGADQVPCLEVYNKIDLNPILAPKISFMSQSQQQQAEAVWLSAKQRLGFDMLMRAIQLHFAQNSEIHHLRLLPKQGKLRARLYQVGQVIAERVDPEGKIYIEVRLPHHAWGQFCDLTLHE